MSPSSNDRIGCEHRGQGIVVIQVTPPERDRAVRLQLTGRQVRSIRHSLTRKNGAFFMELLREGFLKNGAVALDGCLTMPGRNETYNPSFRTILQGDGDIICKIDRNLLLRPDAMALLRGYAAAREQFFRDFQEMLEISRKRLVTFIVSALSAIGTLIYLWTWL